MENRLLTCIAQRALIYVKGDDQLGTIDLELIIDFVAEIIAEKDLYKLLSYVSTKIENCMAFDTQRIKKLSEFMIQSDYTEPYLVDLIGCNQTEDESHESPR